MKKQAYVFLCILFFSLFFSLKPEATGVGISLKTEEMAIGEGEMFRLKFELSSLQPFKKMEGLLLYDENIVSYIKADDGILGGSGKVRINIEELIEDGFVEEYEEDYGVNEENPEAEERKRSFHIVFKALKPGKVKFSFADGLKVLSKNEEELSLSYHPLEVVVKGKREASSLTSLSALSAQGVVLSPEFSKSIYQYKTKVPREVTRLLISALPSDEKAGIKVAGNGDFVFGDNLVKVIVTAEDGSEAVYEIIVTREEKETKAPTNEEENEKFEIKEVVLQGEEGKKLEEREEESDSEQGNRKKIIFYGIMGSVGLITFIILKIVLKRIEKLDEKKK